MLLLAGKVKGAGWKESDMAVIAIVVGLFILLDVVALLGSADTRDGNDWTEHRRVVRG